jgi:hypothetical protein
MMHEDREKKNDRKRNADQPKQRAFAKAHNILLVSGPTDITNSPRSSRFRSVTGVRPSSKEIPMADEQNPNKGQQNPGQ